MVAAEYCARLGELGPGMHVNRDRLLRLTVVRYPEVCKNILSQISHLVHSFPSGRNTLLPLTSSYPGQEVFYRYGGAMLMGLAFQSLVGGMGAKRVVEVLARTGGLSVKVARHRLFETTQHV